MAYLNQQEREKLLNDLKDMSFNKAKSKVRSMDPQGRLSYYRNVQDTANRLYTHYELAGLGTRVTLIEQASFTSANDESSPAKLAASARLVEVIVEPTPDNRT